MGVSVVLRAFYDDLGNPPAWDQDFLLGDPGDKNAPTYAAMQRVSNTRLGDHPATSVPASRLPCSWEASRHEFSD
ncbi:MAG TPA: hypothetical protein VLQ48_12255 [Chloroflexia bacterium]|nr:hypothetical protein [Chloroflexia bacterium]